MKKFKLNLTEKEDVVLKDQKRNASLLKGFARFNSKRHI